MQILTPDNRVFSMERMPNEVDDLQYSVLDYSDQSNVDFFFVPMILLESFSSPAALLQIGPYQIQMPIDWAIIIGDKYVGDLEYIEIKKLNNRPFSAFVFNPISSFSANFYEINIIDIYPDIKWFFPKLKFGHILTIPIGEEKQWPAKRRPGERKTPDCIFGVRDINKLPDVLDIGKIF